MKNRFLKYFFIPIISGIAVISLLFFLSNLFIKSFNLFDSNEIPIISAPIEPIKEKPKNPQGKVIEHTKQEFWGIFDNDNEKNESVEILIPLEPETPPVNITETENKNISIKENIVPKKQLEEDSLKKDFDNKTEEKKLVPKKQNEIDNTSNIKEDETILVPLNRPKFNKNNKEINNIQNKFYVQLASFNNKSLAEKSSKILEEKLAVSLEGQKLTLMEVDLGKNKGYWWRIITNLISRDEAESICSLLKVEGQNCIVRSKK